MAIGLHVPYLLSTIKGTIKPHPFTWILWTTLTIIIFFAQIMDGAGPGAWGTVTVGLICIGIVVASIRFGFDNVKRKDVVLFVIGLLSIPLWLLTKNPTLSVILITTIDLIAFIPTYRKSWDKPYDEPLYLYGLNVLRHGLSLFAIINVTIATAFFPFMIMLANLGLFLFLIRRRKLLMR
jgi:hypothetical protein